MRSGLMTSVEVDPQQRDPVGVRRLDHRLPLEHQRASGFHRENARPGLDERRDGAGPDRRHVEAGILLRLRPLDHAGSGGDRPGAADRGSGARDGLDSKHRSVLHHDRLAHVEGRDRPGDGPAEGHVGPLRGAGSLAAQRPLAGKELRHQRRLGQQADDLVALLGVYYDSGLLLYQGHTVRFHSLTFRASNFCKPFLQ